MSEPSLEELLTREARTEALKRETEALRRGAGEEGPPDPGPAETAAERFTRQLAEQANAERAEQELRRRVQNEHPTAVSEEILADPLRSLARAERVRRRRARRRGVVP